MVESYGGITFAFDKTWGVVKGSGCEAMRRVDAVRSHVVHCADAVREVHAVAGGGVDADLGARADTIVGKGGILAQRDVAGDLVVRVGEALRTPEAGVAVGRAALDEGHGTVAFDDVRSILRGNDVEAD